jgi:hypothetical protein
MYSWSRFGPPKAQLVTCVRNACVQAPHRQPPQPSTTNNSNSNNGGGRGSNGKSDGSDGDEPQSERANIVCPSSER